MIPEEELEDICRRFDRLHRAFIDTSSIIYMHKAGFFDLVGRSIHLVTIRDVIREAGMSDLRIETVTPTSGESTTDRKLVGTAQAAGLPLISEDRAILIVCRNRHIEYYNAYMLLIFLFYRRFIEGEELHEAESKLLETSRYNKWVVDYAEALKWYVGKIR